MQAKKSVHNGEARGFEMGRELTEDELARVCGGVGSSPDANTGNASSLGNLAGLGQLGNELTGQLTNELGGLLGASPQTSSSPSNQNSASQNLVPNLSSLPGLAPLQNLLGGLGL